MNLDAYNFSFNSRAPVEYKPFLEDAMIQAGVTTKDRAAAFLATVGHESGDLYYLEEIADGSDYNGRADLGNFYAGDGPRYKGRGFIQLTGRNNYAAFGKWCVDKGLTSDENLFINQPELVAQPRWAALSAAYYWATTRRSYNGVQESINDYADRRDFVSVTKAVNGGLNGWEDRNERYQSFYNYAGDILPGDNANSEPEKVELQLSYSRDNVVQDTYYNCGPASSQTVILAATGNLIGEFELGGMLGTTVNGTDYIGQFPAVLNAYINGAQYTYRDLPNYPDGDLKEQVWKDISRSVHAGHGVIANIVAPPDNYPRGTRGSISPAYGGGEIYHYIAVMGICPGEGRHVWIADSGFSPYGYWMSFDQLCTLIPPKGYAYSTSDPVISNTNKEVVLFGPDQVGALHEAKMNTREILDILKGIQRDTSLILDQLVGPERKDGNRTFSGWPKTATWNGTDGKTFVEYTTGLLEQLKSLPAKGEK